MDESIDWCSFLECMSSGQWLKSCPRALPKRTMHVYFLWRGPGHWNKRGVPNWISKSSMPTFTDQSTFSCVFSMFKSVHPGVIFWCHAPLPHSGAWSRDRSTSRPGGNRAQCVTWATLEIRGRLSYSGNESVCNTHWLKCSCHGVRKYVHLEVMIHAHMIIYVYCIIHLYTMRNWSKKLHPPRKTGTTNLDSALGDTSRCRLIPPLYFGWVAGHSDQMFFLFWPKMQHAQYHEVRKKGLQPNPLEWLGPKLAESQAERHSDGFCNDNNPC